MKDFRVSVRVRNNRLLERREALGFTQAQLAAAAGVCLEQYGQLERMSSTPLSKAAPGTDSCTGTPWRRAALNVAMFYECSPEDLWPDEILAVKKTASEICASADELVAIAAPAKTPEEGFAAAELADRMRAALATLTPREERVLRRMFGIGLPAGTLEEVGADYGVSREHIRMIGARALRKLRHPSRASALKDFACDPVTTSAHGNPDTWCMACSAHHGGPCMAHRARLALRSSRGVQ